MNTFDVTRKIYNQYASQFADKFEKIPETQQMDEFIALLPEEANVLDLGCGSGRDAEYLSKARLRVKGVDVSEKLIEEAQARRPHISFQVMDMEYLTFPEETFDGVWSKLAILHVERENLPKIIQSVFSVLKPGGVVMIETKAGENEGTEKVSFANNEERYFVYYELDELMQILKSVGFTDVSGYEYTVGNEHATLKKDRVVVSGRKRIV